jgi:hypothetical protein
VTYRPGACGNPTLSRDAAWGPSAVTNGWQWFATAQTVDNTASCSLSIALLWWRCCTHTDRRRCGWAGSSNQDLITVCSRVVIFLPFAGALNNPPLTILAQASAALPATQGHAVVDVSAGVDVPALAADVRGWDGGWVGLAAGGAAAAGHHAPATQHNTAQRSKQIVQATQGTVQADSGPQLVCFSLCFRWEISF